MNNYPNSDFGGNFRLPGPPNFNFPPNMGQPPNFGPPPNMGQPPNFGPPPNMGQPPNFGPPPNIGQPPNFGPPPNMGQPPNFGPPPNIGQPPAGQMPMSAPPSFSPAMPAWHGGSNGIQRCLFRNTFIWTTSGRSFWFFPTVIGREFIAGFRWSNRSGWRFSTIMRENILAFECFR